MIEDPQRQKAFERAYYVKLRRLPSLETQLIECFRILQEFGPEFGAPYTWNNIDLKRGPFRLYARSGFWIYNQQPLFGFAIGAVGIAARFQGRGWFRNFMEIVFHTMPHNLFVVENVDHDGLNQALRLHPNYIDSKSIALRVANCLTPVLTRDYSVPAIIEDSRNLAATLSFDSSVAEPNAQTILTLPQTATPSVGMETVRRMQNNRRFSR